MILRPFRILLCLSAILILFAPSGSGQEAKHWNLPKFSSDPKTLFEAASSVSPKKGTDVVILFDEQTFTFDADGKSVHSIYRVYKILSEPGASSWSSLSIEWEPWHEEKPTLQARVITADLVGHLLDQKSVTDSPASDNDEDVFGDQRVVRAPLPAIVPGVVVETQVIVKENAPLYAAGTVQHQRFGWGVPVQETRLALDAPLSLPLQYQKQLLPDLKIERTEHEGRVQIEFEQGPMEALENQDAYLPSSQPAYPRVTFATGTSWQQIASSYSSIVDAQIHLGSASDLAMQLTQGKKSVDEKIAALVQYLSKEIRYTGVEFDEAGIVPYPPAETLKKKYGDCKDKATLLVAMLRAAGIPAKVALLRVSSREDVIATLPGMGMFDHAIAYVPGPPSYWIDVTDQYARLGQLPARDQGRLSLIAESETTALTMTPVSASSANRLLEKREFYLADNGPARVVETSSPQGVFESGYRSAYPSSDNKETRKKLTDYVKTEYLADKLTKLEFTNPKDLSQQFQLTVEAAPAKRGFTDLDSAIVAIRRESLFYGLPNELQQAKVEPTKKEAEAEESPKKPRTADYQLGEAFVAEWEYGVTPPPGFVAKPLPAKKTETAGPAVYTQEFSVDADGTIHGKLTFDTVKRQFTAAEAEEMRKKVVELRNAQPILLQFQPLSQALLNEGKVKESFQASRTLIAQHPQKAVYHLQMANYLLQAGMGKAAREEGEKAVALEPKSALAQKTLAEILEYDLVGRKFRRGSDYAGAAKAFREAHQLEPEEYETTANLAVLLEYSPDGERYGRGSKLDEAIVEYQKLKEDQIQRLGFQNNLPFALFYAGKLTEARKEAEKLNPQPKSLIVASEAILNGFPAGLAEARKLNSAEDDLKTTLKTAGDMTMRNRAYPQAADLLEAGASGSNSANVMGLASVVRKAKHREDTQFKEDASGTVLKIFVEGLDGTLTPEEMMKMSSKNAIKVMKREDPEEVSKTLNSLRGLRGSIIRQGLPLEAMIDVIITTIQVTSEGDDTNGYRVTLRAPGAPDTSQFVVKENGQYKMLDSSERPNSIGLEILDRIDANNLAGARVLLDWIREAQHLEGGDDSLAGHAFPRLWTKGKEGDARQMKLATAALLCQTEPTAPEGIAILEPALSTGASDSEKLNISVALIEGYSATDAFDKLLALSSALAKDHADSKHLFIMRAEALRGLGHYSEVSTLAAEWLKREPADLMPLRAVAEAETDGGKYSQAIEQTQKIIASDKGEAGDYNQLAWLSLFAGKTNSSDVEAATKAVQLSKSSTSTLHTLGCVYAETGKTKEAREVLIQSMDLLSLDDPDDNYWFAFGRIAEQYGEKQSAITDYQNVKKPKKPLQVPSSSYKLAQMRLAAMANEKQASTK